MRLLPKFLQVKNGSKYQTHIDCPHYNISSSKFPQEIKDLNEMNNDQVKVTIINQWFGEPLTGPSERFRRYAPGLQKRGINIRVIAGLGKEDPNYEIFDGIPVNHIPVTSQKDNHELLKKALKFCRQTGEWPDVINLLAHDHKNFLNILFTKLIHGVPFIWISTMMKMPDRSRINWMQRMREILRVQLFSLPLNYIVTSSKVMADYWISLGVLRNKIEIIPNGVDLKRFRPPNSLTERNMIRQQLKIDLEDEIVLFVGSIVQRKGVDTLISAWNEISTKREKVKLFLVGERRDNPAFLKQIETMVSNSIHPERIKFFGSVHNVEQFMQAADLFVFPSRFEGMPNVVPEAMACGLACIITPFDGLPDEFGRSGHEYCLVENTPADLSFAVIKLLENEDLRTSYAHLGCTWVKSNLDVEVSLDLYEKLYFELSKRSHSKLL